MNNFAYAKPASVKDACGLLADEWGRTEVLAGGTDLVSSLKERITTPEVLVSINGIKDLRGIDSSNDAVVIGAATPLKDVLAHADVRKHFPAIATGITNIASPQMIAIGTIGGELLQRPRCWYYRQGFGLLAMHEGESLIPKGDNRYHAVFGNDGPAYFVNPSTLAPVLIALDATLTIEGASGARDVKAADFYTTPKAENEREYVLNPNEILTRIHIPVTGKRNGLYEIRQRTTLDWPMVSAAVAFDYSGGARQRDSSNARVVLGHVAPTPWHVAKAGEALNGKTLQSVRLAYFGIHEEVLDEAAAAAVEGATPLSRNGYKVHQVRVAVKRAIENALPDREDAWGVNRDTGDA